MLFRLAAVLTLMSVYGCLVAQADEQHNHPPGPYGDPYNIDTYNKVYGYDYGMEAPGSFRAWIFRRYAGSVEMDTKTEYPHYYHGRYIYRGWRPDWIKPSNPDNTPMYPSDFVLPRPRDNGGTWPEAIIAAPERGYVEELPVVDPTPDVVPNGDGRPTDLDLAPLN